ncbi:uncharacterized protein LOC126900507 isoform X2 [Daktulosphaira vitifoliae]|uniref:uncharacterized protein LOC126900507 isoform X2 n=1 Tax=Daktulosphaira vitifoliae TaxID=58002 RepID=UPI0021AA60EE|nr:uncharacterized protein LOC126900507 isoform X2 [Daktulosphaira vitifoliae]
MSLDKIKEFRYMLNYFKLNEHYLLQMYKNIEIYTEEDLKKYGLAIQTHGDVVLLMIQDLHKIDKDHFPYDLMTMYEIILENYNQVDLYLQELIKYANSFNLIYTIQHVGRITIKDFKYILTPNLIDLLCTDNPIDYCISKNDECDTSDNSNEINVYDLGNNDGLDEFKIENIEHFKEVAFKRKQNKSLNLSIDMKDFPKHMVDYFLCSE